MSSSGSSDTSSDPTDDDTTSTSQNSNEKSETKQETPAENNKKESSDDDSSESESSQKTAEKPDVKQKQATVNSTNSKSKSSDDDSEEKSEEDSDEETSESMDESSSNQKKDQKSTKEQKKSTTKKEEPKTPTEDKPPPENKLEKAQTSSDKPKTREVPADTKSQNDNNNDDDNSPPKKDETDTENGRKMDRYGWYVENKKISKQEQQLIQIENQKEAERTQKWLDMTKNWSSFMKKNRNKVAERIKKGIPDQMRSRAWALLCQAAQMKKQYPTPMSELLKRPKHQGYATIDKDLIRTFPQIGFFSRQGFLESLRRILYCYCQTDPVLGYTQGMSFIAGMFLSYMDEETAYYCFLHVMLGQRLNQRGYFLSGFPRLDKANLMLGCLMEKRCPKVLKRMDSLGVIMSMFTPGWFLTVFQSYTWQPEFQLRIFERYLFYGTRGLLNFGIVIILYHQKILEKANMEDFLKILQHPDTSEKMMNSHSVLQDWDKNWLNKAEYEKLLTRCGVQKETESY